MSRILVTGATSMIGMALCQKLIEKKYNVVAVARKASEKTDLLLRQGTEIVLCDMEDYGRIFSKYSSAVDVAVLLAWNGTRGNARNDCVVQSDNYKYNCSILPELQKMKCKKIITSGSQAEYGLWTSNELMDENAPTEPNTEYGKNKLQFYHSVKAFCELNGIRYAEPRYFSIYGPEDFSETLISSTIRKMQSNEPCNFTKGTQLWNYLYIDDAIEALFRLCTTECENGVYNIGSDDTRTLKEYILELAVITGTKSELLFGTIPYPDTGAVSICPNIEKVKKAVDFTPRYSFKEGVEKVIERIGKDS